jgi:hypothetical protein
MQTVKCSLEHDSVKTVTDCWSVDAELFKHLETFVELK